MSLYTTKVGCHAKYYFLYIESNVWKTIAMELRATLYMDHESDERPHTQY